MAIYVVEEDLRREMYNIQGSNKLKLLLGLKALQQESESDTTALVLEKIKESNQLKKLIDLNKLHQDNLSLTDLVLEKIKELQGEGMVPNYPKTEFGNMILLIVQQLSKKGNFSGYTWHDDFFSNALEKVLSYSINNFDFNYINPKTGIRSKAFSYISEISRQAFVEVINERKQEERDMMEYVIPFEDFYNQVKQHYNPVYETVKEVKEQPEIVLSFTYEDDKLMLVQNGDIVREWDKSVCGILQEYRDLTDKIEITYPEDLKIGMNELEVIDSLKYSFLNVNKFRKAKYIPSFPRKEKKDKINKFESWE